MLESVINMKQKEPYDAASAINNISTTRVVVVVVVAIQRSA